MSKLPSNPPPQFILNRGRRNVPEAALLADLLHVAQLLNCNKLSVSGYGEHGQFNPRTLAARFNGWNAALELVNLTPNRHLHVTEKMLVRDMRRVARQLKTRHLRIVQYQAHGKYSQPTVRRLFKSWYRAIEVAKLIRYAHRPRNDQELFDNLQNLREILGRQPKSFELTRPLSRCSAFSYLRRFGTFRNAFLAFEQSKLPPGTPVPPHLMIPPRGTPQRKTPRSVNMRLRYKILTRDNYRCVACGRSPATHPGTALQIDHILSWATGGETEEKNLQTLCDSCNSGKSDSPPSK